MNEGAREEGRERWRDGGRGMKRVREGGSERKGGEMERGRERWRDGESEGGRGRKRGREGGREGKQYLISAVLLDSVLSSESFSSVSLGGVLG